MEAAEVFSWDDGDPLRDRVGWAQRLPRRAPVVVMALHYSADRSRFPDGFQQARTGPYQDCAVRRVPGRYIFSGVSDVVVPLSVDNFLNRLFFLFAREVRCAITRKHPIEKPEMLGHGIRYLCIRASHENHFPSGLLFLTQESNQFFPYWKR